VKLNTPIRANKSLTVVNMLGGPGVGKSVLRSQTFIELKLQHLPVEEVSEYAKDMVWDQRHNMFIEQDMMLTQQYWRLRRLVLNDIEVAITDTSLLLGFIYSPADYFPTFFDHMLSLYYSFNNINIFLRRGNFPYQQEGRNQTLEQAHIKDMEVIDKIVIANSLPVYVLTAGDSENANTIADIVLGKSDLCLLNPATLSRSDLVKKICGTA